MSSPFNLNPCFTIVLTRISSVFEELIPRPAFLDSLTRRQRNMQKLIWKILMLHDGTPCYCCYCQQLKFIGTTSKTESAVENVGGKPQIQQLFIFNNLITENK